MLTVVERVEGRQVVALVAQLAVGGVLDDEEIVFRRELHDALAALEAQGDAGGVLEVGDEVEELVVLLVGAEFLEEGLEEVDVDAVVVDRHAQRHGAVGAEGLRRRGRSASGMTGR
jgi:hypothetical protein